MTDIMKLLGDFPEINPANYGDDEVNALNAWGIAAHTAIEALQGEVERLKGLSVTANVKGLIARKEQAEAERDALAAKLDELQRQEPIGFVIKDSDYTNSIIREQGGHHTQPVYAAPKAMEPLTDEQIHDLSVAFRGGADWSEEDFETAELFARSIEAAHGITKGTP